MTDINHPIDIHLDDVADTYPRWFSIRVACSRRGGSSVGFTKLVVDIDNFDQGIEALRRLKEQDVSPAQTMRLAFYDDNYVDDKKLDRSLLVWRHDQIVTLMRKFTAREGLKMENAFLDLTTCRFETIVLIS